MSASPSLVFCCCIAALTFDSKRLPTKQTTKFLKALSRKIWEEVLRTKTIYDIVPILSDTNSLKKRIAITASFDIIEEETERASYWIRDGKRVHSVVTLEKAIGYAHLEKKKLWAILMHSTDQERSHQPTLLVCVDAQYMVCKSDDKNISMLKSGRFTSTRALSKTLMQECCTWHGKAPHRTGGVMVILEPV